MTEAKQENTVKELVGILNARGTDTAQTASEYPAEVQIFHRG